MQMICLQSCHTNALEAWCVKSQLGINVSKSKELFLCTKQDLTINPVSLDGQPLETVVTFKYLGTSLV